MTFTTVAIILASVSLSAMAQTCFKYGVSSPTSMRVTWTRTALDGVLSQLLNPAVLIGLLLYGIGTLLWLQVLARIELSQAYPFVGLGFIMTALLGVVLFGDTVGPLRLAGIVLVMSGIAVIARS